MHPDCTSKQPLRFWSRVDCSESVTDCWNWTGRVNSRGYGAIKWQRKAAVVHRVSWTLVHGIIPDGMYVCHRCDNRLCVNPAHLFLGTNKDNVDDKVRKGRQARHTGELNGNAKLTEHDIRYIRAQYANGVLQKDLAIEFRISSGLVSNIITRKLWAHVD